jgi:hypothetical protein
VPSKSRISIDAQYNLYVLGHDEKFVSCEQQYPLVHHYHTHVAHTHTHMVKVTDNVRIST